MKATRHALLTFAVLLASMTALVVVRGSRSSTAAASTSAPSVVALSPSPASTAVVVTKSQSELALALHDLEAGATCNDRRQAIQRLIELGDPNAVAALRTARVRKDNACLRADAAQAIKALDGRI